MSSSCEIVLKCAFKFLHKSFLFLIVVFFFFVGVDLTNCGLWLMIEIVFVIAVFNLWEGTFSDTI